MRRKLPIPRGFGQEQAHAAKVGHARKDQPRADKTWQDQPKRVDQSGQEGPCCVLEVLCQHALGAIRFPREYSLRIGFCRACYYVSDLGRPVT